VNKSETMCQLPEAERDLIERAAKQSGFDVYVAPGIAYGKIGIRTREPERNHQLFWDAYRKLREAP
jgi:hypothetical protein